MHKIHWQRQNLYWLLLTLFVIVCDQVSKWWMTNWLDLYALKPIFPLFSFTLLHNQGAAFSFLNGDGAWASWLLGAIALTVSGVLILWILKTPRHRRLLLAALALILGGALGNLIDRITSGHVVDFLLFHYNDTYFPAFNLADSAITIGAVMLAIEMIFFNKER